MKKICLLSVHVSLNECRPSKGNSKGDCFANNHNACNHAQMYFLALYLKEHIELILLCCVYSAININFGKEKSKGLS